MRSMRLLTPLATATIIVAGALTSCAPKEVLEPKPELVALPSCESMPPGRVGPVEDSIGVVKCPKGAPIDIGAYVTLSGPDAVIGIDEFRSVEIAVDDKGGMLVGHPIRVQEEDGKCTGEGGQTAATKLAANQNILMVAGGMCSSETVLGAPILWKAGIPSVGISPTAPMLTDPNRDEGYHGFIRTVWND